MKDLHIDLETYSDVDITKAGLYKYVQSAAFEILLFAYAYDDDPVRIIDIAAGETVPSSIITDLYNQEVRKVAHNAAFEINCLNKFFYTETAQWHCTMVHAYYCGLPGQLGQAGKAVGLPEGRQKMIIGKQLIRYFCIPCKPTKANGGRMRNLPCHAPEKWELFKTYCKRDVDVEKSIRRKLHNFPIPESEMELYRLDQRINDRGVLVDMGLVEQAIACERLHKEVVTKRAYELTGLENPNSVAQLKGWLGDKGMEAESLSKKAVADMIAETDGEVEELLRLRLLMAKTSVKKYEAMERSVCSDGRVHGMLMFCGANRTSRWSGKIVQIQNLPKNYIPDLELARDLVKQGRFEDIELLYDSTPNVLSELIRTAFIPKPGCRFVVADFSAIEARVLAWLSGEQWRLDVFTSHGKIYEASASSMFHVPMEEITKGSTLRQKGKLAELGLGFGGAAGALISMGALDMGLTEEELPGIVQRWRTANPAIVRCWTLINNAALTAVREGRATRLPRLPRLTIAREANFTNNLDFLTVLLPSGRKLFYAQPHLTKDRWGRDSIGYYGVNQTTKKWVPQETYGGKLTENIVQAIARDCLAEAVERLEAAGIPVVFQIHDEVVCEVPKEHASLQKVVEIMSENPAWARDLPLAADGWVGDFFTKD